MASLVSPAFPFLPVVTSVGLIPDFARRPTRRSAAARTLQGGPTGVKQQPFSRPWGPSACFPRAPHASRCVCLFGKDQHQCRPGQPTNQPTKRHMDDVALSVPPNRLYRFTHPPPNRHTRRATWMTAPRAREAMQRQAAGGPRGRRRALYPLLPWQPSLRQSESARAV